jgi:hypothetical protein
VEDNDLSSIDYSGLSKRQISKKKYYEKNKERVKENAKNYLNRLKVENPEKLKEYRHRAYLKRKEKMSSEVA